MDLILKAAVYRSSPDSFFTRDDSIKDCLEKIGHIIGEQTKEVAFSFSDFSGSRIKKHFLCSTVLDSCFMSGEFSWHTVSNEISKHLDFAIPSALVNAYECASWGFVLRYLLQDPELNSFLISIIDLNIYDLDWWKSSDHWGKSGFGVSTLLFERGCVNRDCVFIGSARSANKMQDFAFWCKKLWQRFPDTKLVLPFFPGEISRNLNKVLHDCEKLEDLHSRWGHCFGSDPWIALASSKGIGFSDEQRFLLSSHALNGYHSACIIKTDPKGLFQCS